MKNKKRYGDTNTSLELTEKAERLYLDTDPMSIYENSDGTFTIESCLINCDGLTAAQVNSELELLFDELAALDD